MAWVCLVPACRKLALPFVVTWPQLSRTTWPPGSQHLRWLAGLCRGPGTGGPSLEDPRELGSWKDPVWAPSCSPACSRKRGRTGFSHPGNTTMNRTQQRAFLYSPIMVAFNLLEKGTKEV